MTVVCLTVLIFSWNVFFTENAYAESVVHRIRIDGIINPISTRFIIEAVDRAENAKVEALIIELDTPGGLLEATREIVQRFLAADVPIIVYVSPDGARAGSAGVFITLAAHIATMAPSTNIGAAHPVSIGGSGFPGGQADSAGGKIMSDKVTNDAAALARSIAETRGRNVSWAEKAVRSSDAITALDAMEQNVIDFIAPSLDSLLMMIDGRVVKLKAGERTLHTVGATVISTNMTWKERFFDRISDPNIAYIFLMVGIYGVLFELYSPGAILPGVLGVLGLLMAFFAFQTLPVSAVGILLILSGIILLIMEIKVISYGLLTVAGSGALFVGSLMLFDANTTVIHVSLGVIIPTVLASTLFVLFALGLGLKAQQRRIETGVEAMIGMSGECIDDFIPANTDEAIDSLKTSIFSGMVLVNGEYWKAICVQRLIRGCKVKVIRIDGLMLTVDSTTQTL